MKERIKSFCELHKVSLFVIFGSYTSSKMHKGSDVDVAILPKYDEEVRPQVDKLKVICELEQIFEHPIDLVILTPQTDPLLEYEIFSNGRALYEEKDGLFEECKLSAWKKYLDTKKIRDLEAKFVKNYIEELKKEVRPQDVS